MTAKEPTESSSGLRREHAATLGQRAARVEPLSTGQEDAFVVAGALAGGLAGALAGALGGDAVVEDDESAVDVDGAESELALLAGVLESDVDFDDSRESLR